MFKSSPRKECSIAFQQQNVRTLKDLDWISSVPTQPQAPCSRWPPRTPQAAPRKKDGDAPCLLGLDAALSRFPPSTGSYQHNRDPIMHPRRIRG